MHPKNKAKVRIKEDIKGVVRTQKDVERTSQKKYIVLNVDEISFAESCKQKEK